MSESSKSTPQSLINAIYERYFELSSHNKRASNSADLSSSENSNSLEFAASSLSSESTSASNSSTSSPVTESTPASPSQNIHVNTSTSFKEANSFQQQIDDISFYMPVGFSPKKTQSGVVLSSISLVMSDQSISHIGDLDELENSCKNVLELDLSKNEIDDWEEIKKLLLAMKKLRLLNLSLNPLAKPRRKSEESNSNNLNDFNANIVNNVNEHSDELMMTIDYFVRDWNQSHLNSSLHTLILNSCFIDMRVVECLLNKLNNLNELHLSSNGYSHVNFSKDFQKSTLKILYFNNNNLNDWNEVCKLGKCFPNLENLVISHNNLSNFSTSNEANSSTLCTSNCFKNLQILIINKLKINEWSVIDQLREFPHLKHVRIQNIPLLNNYNDDEKYYMLVAHLDESIDSLNGSKITNDDKENCERKYIRHYMDFATKPKRYYELENKHGKLNKLADVNLDIRKRVQVKIKFGEKHLYEKIDVRQTVGEFKKHLEKFVGQPSTRFKLFYIDIEACSMSIYGPEELKHPNRCLYSFNIRDGDEFEIDLKPPPNPITPSHQSPSVIHSASEYQFQHSHLHHLHFHHYNSHINNNSLHQLPLFNYQVSNNTPAATKPMLIRNRKASETSNANSNSSNNANNGECCSSRTCKRTKSVFTQSISKTKPDFINKHNNSRNRNEQPDANKNSNNEKIISEEDDSLSTIHHITDYCSLPSKLSNLDNNFNINKQQEDDESSESTNLVIFTTGNEEQIDEIASGVQGNITTTVDSKK